jgi:hypothetical protein
MIELQNLMRDLTLPLPHSDPNNLSLIHHIQLLTNQPSTCMCMVIVNPIEVEVVAEDNPNPPGAVTPSKPILPIFFHKSYTKYADDCKHHFANQLTATNVCMIMSIDRFVAYHWKGILAINCSGSRSYLCTCKFLNTLTQLFIDSIHDV